MSIVNDEPFLDRENRRKLYEDADKLLCLAEQLQEKCEHYEYKFWLQIMVQGSLLLSALVADFYSILWLFLVPRGEPVFNGWMGAVAVLTSLFAIGGIWYAGYVWRQTSRLLARERRALHGIVDMLRDLETGIAEQANLSTLERTAFRIRLSRFDIGPGK